MVSVGLGLVPAWRRSSLSIPSATVGPFHRQARRLLALLVPISFLATTALMPTMTPRPHHADQRLITAGIWTVHFGIDDAGRDSQYRMRDLIKLVKSRFYVTLTLIYDHRDMQLDIVGLLETDLHVGALTQLPDQPDYPTFAANCIWQS